MAATGIEYVELDLAAAEAVTQYLESRRKRADHDRKSAALKKSQKEALEQVREALGACRLGQLPDGRIVRLITHEREVKPAKGYGYSFDELDVTDN